ncbi:MAG: hypothetical protein O2912_06965 [Proteobacteria bacterium]|nr:hypothetical protein [Pseudomonadota bacterium]
MMRFALCTSVYESGRPFLSDWITSAITAAAIADAANSNVKECTVSAVIAVDDLIEPGKAFASLSNAMPTVFAQAPAQASTAGVREIMLRAVVQSDADIAVFCDMDDRLHSMAIERHADALIDADFSFGDLQPVDANGQATGDTFFANAEIPETVSEAAQLIDRNWLGFSNTAVMRSRLPEAALTVPDNIIAVDWWFYTQLLKAGLKGARAQGTVADYRFHGNNVLGPKNATDLNEIKHRCDIVRRHYKSLDNDSLMTEKLSTVERLINRLQNDPHSLAAAVIDARAHATLWHEDIGFLARLP